MWHLKDADKKCPDRIGTSKVECVVRFVKDGRDYGAYIDAQYNQRLATDGETLTGNKDNIADMEKPSEECFADLTRTGTLCLGG